MKLLGLMVSGLIYANVSFGNADIATYRKSGDVVMNQIISKKIDETVLQKEVNNMVVAAISVTKAYMKAYPKGAKVLQVLVDKIEDIKKQSFDEVEKQWHDIGYFAGKEKELGIDLSDEDNEHFTDPIHCIVHPILTLKAGQMYIKSGSKDEKHLQTMKEELKEGLEQAGNIEAKLKTAKG